MKAVYERRTVFFPLIAAVLPLLLCCGGDRRPSVLLVTIDTLRADRLGCYGAGRVKTPILDRLAREGVLFADCSSVIPETSPAHVSILSGLLPKDHGTRQNGVAVDTSVAMLPAILRRAGYVTAGFVSGFPLTSKFGFSTGFDLFDDHMVDGYTSHNGVIEGVERSAEKTTDSFLFWLRKVDRPFFAWVHYFDPHSAYAPPGPFRRMYYSGDERDLRNRSLENIPIPSYLMLNNVTDIDYPVALYEGEVSYTDHELGRLLDGLAGKGILDDMLIVVVGDHGESLTEHDYYFGHSRFLYEQSLHVPLLFRWPGVIPEGEIVEEPVSIIDVARALLDLLGRGDALPSAAPGIVPLIDGARRAPSPLFLERSVLAGPGMSAVRTGSWKLIHSPESGEELYDLAADPAESRNAVDTNPARAAALRALLDRWSAGLPGRSDILDEKTREMLKGLGYLN